MIAAVARAVQPPQPRPLARWYFCLALFAGCDSQPPAEEAEATASESDVLLAVASSRVSPVDGFMRNLTANCGAAYPGSLTLEPPGDDMLTGTEALIVHFRECGSDTLRIPFHIEVEATNGWDRSRTWVLTRAPGGRLELRHDHRKPDGTPAERTMYGGITETFGAATRQDFLSVERTEESGYPRGWRIEVVPGRRYTYGTTRQGDWSWRVDFDLTRPIEAPPPPWGFEDRP